MLICDRLGFVRVGAQRPNFDLDFRRISLTLAHWTLSKCAGPRFSKDALDFGTLDIVKVCNCRNLDLDFRRMPLDFGTLDIVKLSKLGTRFSKDALEFCTLGPGSRPRDVWDHQSGTTPGTIRDHPLTIPGPPRNVDVSLLRGKKSLTLGCASGRGGGHYGRVLY